MCRTTKSIPECPGRATTLGICHGQEPSLAPTDASDSSWPQHRQAPSPSSARVHAHTASLRVQTEREPKVPQTGRVVLKQTDQTKHAWPPPDPGHRLRMRCCCQARLRLQQRCHPGMGHPRGGEPQPTTHPPPRVLCGANAARTGGRDKSECVRALCTKSQWSHKAQLTEAPDPAAKPGAALHQDVGTGEVGAPRGPRMAGLQTRAGGSPGGSTSSCLQPCHPGAQPPVGRSGWMPSGSYQCPPRSQLPAGVCHIKPLAIPSAALRWDSPNFIAVSSPPHPGVAGLGLPSESLVIPSLPTASQSVHEAESSPGPGGKLQGKSKEFGGKKQKGAANLLHPSKSDPQSLPGWCKASTGTGHASVPPNSPRPLPHPPPRRHLRNGANAAGQV